MSEPQIIHYIAGRVASALRCPADDNGQTLTEHGILITFIALVVLVGAQLLGTNAVAWFVSTAGAV